MKYFRVDIRNIEFSLLGTAADVATQSVYTLHLKFAGKYKTIELSTDRRAVVQTNGAHWRWPSEEFCFIYKTEYPDQLKRRYLLIESARRRFVLADRPFGAASVSLYILATGPQSYRLQLQSAIDDRAVATVMLACEMTELCSDVRCQLTEVAVSSPTGRISETNQAAVAVRASILCSEVKAPGKQQQENQQQQRWSFEDVGVGGSADVVIPTTDMLQLKLLYLELRVLADQGMTEVGHTSVPLLQEYHPGNTTLSTRVGPLSLEPAHNLHLSFLLRIENGPSFCQMVSLTNDDGTSSNSPLGTTRGVEVAGAVLKHFPIPDKWSQALTLVYDHLYRVLPEPTIDQSKMRLEEKQLLLRRHWATLYTALLQQRADGLRRLKDLWRAENDAVLGNFDQEFARWKRNLSPLDVNFTSPVKRRQHPPLWQTRQEQLRRATWLYNQQVLELQRTHTAQYVALSATFSQHLHAIRVIGSL